jgi:hypothetical protein
VFERIKNEDIMSKYEELKSTAKYDELRMLEHRRLYDKYFAGGDLFESWEDYVCEVNKY